VTDQNLSVISHPQTLANSSSSTSPSKDTSSTGSTGSGTTYSPCSLSGSALYDSRARVWSADLGAFLQPDEYVYLSRGGTLWSWPGQNPYRWRDPSGHLAGSEWYWAARALAADAPELLPAGAASYAAGYFLIGPAVFAAQDDSANKIAKAAARDKEEKAGAAGKECKTEAGGGGAKGPPAGAGDTAADAPDPRVPQKALDALQHIQNNGSPPPGTRGGGGYANDGRGNGEILPETDSNGNDINYREWDVDKYQPGVNRGPERLVTGSDGSAYYTGDHYGTFVRIP